MHFLKENQIMSLKSKLEFFIESRHALGRTALILQGGSLIGLYHLGVIKVLY